MAAAPMRRIVQAAGFPVAWTLHSDNGGAMNGATLQATLPALGVAQSFSRPRVSDDNPVSEALFRTVKYCPSFPDGPFASIEAVRTWAASFVA